MKDEKNIHSGLEVHMRFAAFLLMISLTFLTVSCSSTDTAQTEQETGVLENVRLPMGYIPNIQYAPFYVAVDKGFFAEQGIEIDFDYSYETDGVTLVGANELQFALVSGEQVLLARAQDLPVVYVYAWWQEYPVSIAALEQAGIENPSDLEDKKIGIPGLFGASYIGLRALLEAGGLDESDVTLDSIGFNQVEALISGQEDAVVVYLVNEPVQLRAMGYAIDEIAVADYAQLASNGLITNETTIEEKPELIEKMINSFQKGLEYTIENPEEAFEISKKFIEGLDEKRKALNIIMAQYSDQQFQFPENKVKATTVFKVEIESMTGKQSGI